jgi:protein gp37
MVKRFPHLHGERLDGFDGRMPKTRPALFSEIQTHPDRLDIPLRWRKPRRIFVCSMGDLFHEDVPDEWIYYVLGVIADAERHTYMLLTKRPERAKKILEDAHNHVCYESTGCPADDRFPLHNLWLGITAENQEMAAQRIPILLQTPAAARFVSVEPMLGPVDLTKVGRNGLDLIGNALALPGMSGPSRSFGTRLDWVILGGETGAGAREMDFEWAWSIRDQCREAGVPFFYKGKGTHGGIRKNYHNYATLDGREWKEFPV